MIECHGLGLTQQINVARWISLLKTGDKPDQVVDLAALQETLTEVVQWHLKPGAEFTAVFCLPTKLLNRLQIIYNSAARIITITKPSDHITPILIQLHWLPVQYRSNYKNLVLTFKVLHNLAPTCLSDLLQDYTPSCSLRSSSAGLLIILPQHQECQSFQLHCPHTSNSLRPKQHLNHTSKLTCSHWPTHCKVQFTVHCPLIIAVLLFIRPPTCVFHLMSCFVCSCSSCLHHDLTFLTSVSLFSCTVRRPWVSWKAPPNKMYYYYYYYCECDQYDELSVKPRAEMSEGCSVQWSHIMKLLLAD